jgi:septal ring factor EnvC (AmiA/AmiB activator)
VENVIPELVLKEADASQPRGLNYMGLLPVVIKAMQEQQSQIQQQQKLIENQNHRLVQQASQLEQLQIQLKQVKRTIRRQ